MTASIRTGVAFAIVFPLVSVTMAQERAPIQDNSFLLEEAYNQEKGVVQHISAFSLSKDGDSWTSTFTQEWPVGSIRHQLSYTLPVLHANGTGLGDIALNYRYQLAGTPDTRIAVAPRASLLMPTGSEDQGRGTGELGFQADLPLSFIVMPRFVTHWNTGVTAVRNTATTFNVGASAIWLAWPSFNVVLEGVWLTNGSNKSAFLNPGIRWAFNFASGLQVVPGVAYTIGVGPSNDGEDALFLYLSFEHPFERR